MKQSEEKKPNAEALDTEPLAGGELEEVSGGIIRPLRRYRCGSPKCNFTCNEITANNHKGRCPQCKSPLRPLY